MKVVFHIVNGEEFEMILDEGEYINNIQKTIMETKLPSTIKVRILHKGKVLKEGTTLGQNGIKDNDKIYVHPNPPLKANPSKKPEDQIPEKPAEKKELSIPQSFKQAPNRPQAMFLKTNPQDEAVKQLVLSNPKGAITSIVELVRKNDPDLADLIKDDPTKLLTLLGVSYKRVGDDITVL